MMKMKLYLLCLVVLLQWQLGCSQNLCAFTEPRGLIADDDPLFLDLTTPDPVCIRCVFGTGLNRVLYPDTTYIINPGGSLLMNGSDGVIFNSDGSVIINNPGAVFSDSDTLTCHSQTAEDDRELFFQFTITIQQLVFLPPVLTPDGGNDGIVDVVEGSDLTLSCDQNPSNTASLNLRYQWFDSSGNALTAIAVTSPHEYVLNNISREASGEYVCRNTLTANNEVRMTSVTINVQCPIGTSLCTERIMSASCSYLRLTQPQVPRFCLP